MLILQTKPGYRKIPVNEYINVQNCYHISVSEHTDYINHFADFNELIYVTSGEIHISLKSIDYTVKSGQALIISEYMQIETMYNTKDETKYTIVDFSCSDSLVSDIAMCIIDVTNSHYFSDLIARLEMEMMHQTDGNFFANALLLSVIRELDTYKSNSAVKDTDMNEVMRYIDENINKIITVAMIAEKFGYNKDYLQRKFHARFNIAIKQCINEKKLQMAKKLLISTEMPYGKIAATLGFDDSELFIKYFKYHEKMTPQRFRMLNQIH